MIYSDDVHIVGYA